MPKLESVSDSVVEEEEVYCHDSIEKTEVLLSGFRLHVWVICEAVIIVSAWLCVRAWVCVYVRTYASIISGHFCVFLRVIACLSVQTLHLQPLNKWQIPIRTQEQKINKSREVTSGKHRVCLCVCGFSFMACGFTVFMLVTHRGLLLFALCHNHKSVVYTCGGLMAD